MSKEKDKKKTTERKKHSTHSREKTIEKGKTAQ